MTSAAAGRFRHRLRVRWADVDPQGVVFNAHYLAYADTAVTEYWRALGLPYQRIPETFGGEFFVRHAELSYQGSARYDDWVDVRVRCTKLGRSSMGVSCAIETRGQLAVAVNLVYVLADPLAKQPLEIPPGLRGWIEAYEAGEAMTTVRLGSWDELAPLARPLRRAVFIDEQHVPEELEWDDDDATAVHAVVLNRAGQAIATARLLQPEPGVAKIGRMAVDAALRGSGVGRQMLEALLAQARERGDRQATLHAQVSAAGFYARAGFTPSGPEFDEAGIAHVVMSRAL